MITLPLSTAQLVVAVFILMPSVCALTTWVTNRLDTRAQRQALRAREKDVTFRNRLLDERAEIQNARDASLTQREEALAVHEHEWWQKVQAADANIRATAEDFDTMIRVEDWDLPHPNVWDDTVEVPAVEEDE